VCDADTRDLFIFILFHQRNLGRLATDLAEIMNAGPKWGLTSNKFWVAKTEKSQSVPTVQSL